MQASRKIVFGKYSGQQYPNSKYNYEHYAGFQGPPLWRWQATSKPKRKTDRQKTENNEIAVLDYRIGADAEVADKIVELAIPRP